MSPRERKIILALGAPGMGKSALAKQVIRAYEAQHGHDSVRALDPSGTFPEQGEWPGRKGVTEWIDELTDEGRGNWHGLLVLDDADRYLTSAASTESFRDVWLANRHLGLDVLVTAHRPQGVPKDLIASSSELWLFAQEEPRALEYLAEVRAVRTAMESAATKGLPTRVGYALRVIPRDGSAELVKLF